MSGLILKYIGSKVVGFIIESIIKLFKKNGYSFMNFIVNWQYIGFDKAVGIMADATKALLDISEFAKTKEEAYGYYTQQLLSLAKNNLISIYKENYPGKDKIKVLLSEMGIGFPEHKDFFVKKSDLYSCLIYQRRLSKRNKEIHQEMDKIESSGVKGREYQYLQEERENISNKLHIYFYE